GRKHVGVQGPGAHRLPPSRRPASGIVAPASRRRPASLDPASLDPASLDPASGAPASPIMLASIAALASIPALASSVALASPMSSDEEHEASNSTVITISPRTTPWWQKRGAPQSALSRRALRSAHE